MRAHPSLHSAFRAALFVVGLIVSAGAAEVRADVSGWPHVIDDPVGRIVVYEPTIESVDGDVLRGRVVLALTPPYESRPVFGVGWFESRIEVEPAMRVVKIQEMKLTHARFPGSTAQESADYAGIVTREAAWWEMTLPLDEMLAALDAARREQVRSVGLNVEPPEILFETTPSLLVFLDGEANPVPVKDSPLQRVVNTPYFMVYDETRNSYFLNGADHWFTATHAAGPWKHVRDVPAAVSALYARLTEATVEQRNGGDAIPPPDRVDEGPVPRIIVRTEPAELIVTEGEPRFASLGGTDLLYMSNTASDVLLDLVSQKYYVVLSGRWFRSGSLDGPWEFVRPDHLPEAFAKIPPGSEKGGTLVHVSGTPQAEEALMDAAVPQTAAILRDEAELTVEYDGRPDFRKISGTDVKYAVNTTSQVLKIDGRYYACEQAIWFVADRPEGPWRVSDRVPGEIEEIPPESSLYNVKFVQVYDHTPDVVYVGYLPAYVGCFPFYGTVVWGTGWHHPGWWRNHYYPRPVTYGFHARYRPYLGWSFGFGYRWPATRFCLAFGGWGYPGWWGPVGWIPPIYPYPSHHVAHNHGGPSHRPSTYERSGAAAETSLLARTEPLGTNRNLYRIQRQGASFTSASKVRSTHRTPAARGIPSGVSAGRESKIDRRIRSEWRIPSVTEGTKASPGRTGRRERTPVLRGPNSGKRRSPVGRDHGARTRDDRKKQRGSRGGGSRGGGRSGGSKDPRR